jgi:putative nucleotidyltransferase with HDIG domain
MDDTKRAEELVKRLAVAVRTSAIYSQTHPIVRRNVDMMCDAFDEEFRHASQLTMGFLGDDILVGRSRLRGSSALMGLVRHFREMRVERISFAKSMGRESLRGMVGAIAERTDRPLADRLAAAGVTGVGIGVFAEDDTETPPEDLGVLAARNVYGTAISAAESVWSAAKEGNEPDPGAARSIIDTLAKAVSQDRTSMMALTSVKSHDPYTFTHMVNVSLLTMAQARSLGLHDDLVQEFGLAGLMHDVGKTRIPAEILNKPGKLTDEERRIIERHVVDGAQILRKTTGMPALAPIVAFEHHLRQDLSGYPQNIGSRTLNLCTMLVSIADVFDALRSTRAYRGSLPADRVRHMLNEQAGTAFEPTLLRRFVTLMGIFPVGTLVRLTTGEIGVVTAEHPSDPLRPQVKLVRDESGAALPEPRTVDTSARDDRGRQPFEVLEAIDGGEVGVDPVEAMTA